MRDSVLVIMEANQKYLQIIDQSPNREIYSQMLTKFGFY